MFGWRHDDDGLPPSMKPTFNGLRPFEKVEETSKEFVAVIDLAKDGPVDCIMFACRVFAIGVTATHTPFHDSPFGFYFCSRLLLSEDVFLYVLSSIPVGLHSSCLPNTIFMFLPVLCSACFSDSSVLATPLVIFCLLLYSLLHASRLSLSETGTLLTTNIEVPDRRHLQPSNFNIQA